MHSTVKQVIVLRTDTDPKMRKGKMVAQGSHSSQAYITRRLEPVGPNLFQVKLSNVEIEWLNQSFPKIVVGCELPELLKIEQKARDLGIEAHKVTDKGLTEFKEPTITCIALGPDYSEKLDPLTGHLKLL